MPDSEPSKTLAAPASARASKDFHILLPWEEATEIERAAADRGLRPTHIIRERLSEWQQIQPLMRERDRQEITMEAIRFMVEQIFYTRLRMMKLEFIGRSGSHRHVSVYRNYLTSRPTGSMNFH